MEFLPVAFDPSLDQVLPEVRANNIHTRKSLDARGTETVARDWKTSRKQRNFSTYVCPVLLALTSYCNGQALVF